MQRRHTVAMTTRSRTRSLALVAILLGLVALAWAIFSSSGSCVRVASDVGTCSDNMPVKRVVGVVGAVLLVAPTLFIWRVTVVRRHPH